jgi:hypothetical protein
MIHYYTAPARWPCSPWVPLCGHRWMAAVGGSLEVTSLAVDVTCEGCLHLMKR